MYLNNGSVDIFMSTQNTAVRVCLTQKMQRLDFRSGNAFDKFNW